MPGLMNPAIRERRIIDRIDIQDGCWVWTGSIDTGGYGRYTSTEKPGACKSTLAHRIVYEMSVGPIPAGLTLDHLCRVRSCVNPDHLEPVTHSENIMRGEGAPARHARKTHCIHGHEFSELNVRRNAKGHRACLACERAR